MAYYFDEQQWTEWIKEPNWYLRFPKEYKKLKREAERNSDIETLKEEVYKFFEEHLIEDDIALGSDGQNWDKERKLVDTVVIHHTKNPSGITWQQLSAMHLIRIYVPHYSSPPREEKYIKGEPIFSHHFRDNQQVFYSYHWIVRNDGKIERLLNDDEIGWHAGNWDINRRSVGIMLDNDYEDKRPSDKELQAIASLIKEKYGAVLPDRIFGHREVKLVGETSCPSNLFLSTNTQKGLKEDLLDLL